MQEAPPRVRRFTLLAWFVAALGGFGLLRWWHGLYADYLYDDAFIAYRFSDHWARGLGPTWNPGEDPVEGFTSPLWVALGAAGERLFGVMPEASLPLVSACAWCVLVGLVMPWATARLLAESPRLAAASLVPASLAVAAAAPLALQIWGGLETVAFTTILAATVAYAAVARPTRGSGLALAGLSLLAISARPDAVAALAPVWAFAPLRRDPGERRHMFVGAAALAGMLAVYVGIRAAYYGYPLPNTFYIKDGDWAAGTAHVWQFLKQVGWLPAGWLVLAGLGRGRVLRDRAFLILALAAVTFTLAYARVEPVQGKAFRFLVPSLPLWVLATVRAVAVVVAREAVTWRRVAGVVLAAGAVVAALVAIDRHAQDEHRKLRGFFLGVRGFHVPVGRGIGDLADLEPPPLLATADVGAFPYYTHAPTLDLAGLCDEEIAREGLSHAYLAARRPDLLILQDLPLAPTGERRERDARGPADLPVFELRGKLWTIDTRRHRRLPDDIARVHTGLASTYIVATMPGFASEYEHVASWPFLTIDTYEVFVRTAYPARDELIRRLRAVRVPGRR